MNASARRVVSFGALLSVCLAATALPARAAATQEQKRAADILAATGVQGGLIVHLGCGDGTLTAALRANDSYLVHGLDADPKNVAAARKRIASLGLYGKVSVDRLAGTSLPYIDNLVNLLVASGGGRVASEEIMRVLAPQGVAYIQRDGKWTKTVKPRPKDIDEWTHYLHDASNNAVSHDTVVGPPRRLQWVGSPRWARHHDHMASMSALVSAGGRLFYIIDEGPTASIQLPPQWVLVARDAFNGTVLWKRPMGAWNTHRWPLKSGPAQLPRRLVAVGDRVYVTLSLDAPLTALDAATGKTLHTCQGTKPTEEIIEHGGVLFLLVGGAPSKWPEFRQRDAYVWDNTRRANSEWAWDEKGRRIVAVAADTGRVLWQKPAKVAPLTLGADATRVVFHDGERVICLNRQSGKEAWRSEPVARRSPMPVCFGPTLVLWQDVVLFAGGTRQMVALSAKTGKTLWQGKHHRGGHQSPEDLLVVGGLAWSGAVAGGGDSGVFTGRDVRTGEVKSEFAPDVKTYWFHHRCYRSKATERYILPSRTGIEFVDPKTKHWEPHHWVRGGCIYGIMPCNGLVYAPPHSCGCYLEAKLYGFNALAPAKRDEGRGARDEGAMHRLERGPAFSAIANRQSAIGNPADWPTYRHDAARSGCTEAAVPGKLGRAWERKLGGKLSAVVVADGKLFVACIDSHTLHALDAASGEPAWDYTAGGRIDSPPTIHQGTVLFGSADGWVYCLRAADGALAWRLRAGPSEQRHVAFEQVESVWPVHGSVLVQNGVAYCVAGRSMFLDGGLRLLRIDPATGRLLGERVLDDRDPTSGKNLQVHVKGLTMPVALPDVLSSDGKLLYMRSQQFDLEGKRGQVAPISVNEQVGEGAHLFSEVGLLDDTWFHRSYWLYGRSVAGGYGGWFQAARLVPAGRLMVFDDQLAYGYGRRPEYVCNASVLEYRLYAATKQANAEAIRRVRRANGLINSRSRRRSGSSSDWKLRREFSLAELSAVDFKWAHDHPSVQARAMVKAGDTLFVAGPPDVMDERKSFRLPDDPEMLAKLRQQRDALEGRLGGRLWAVSATDGKPLARYKLDTLPVFDGMAAAGGRLYLATTAGKVICLAGGQAAPLPAADDEPLQVMTKEPPEPDYLRPPEVRRDKEFHVVRAAVVLNSKLAYRIRREDTGRFAYAVNKLKTPLTKKAVLTTKLRAAPEHGFGRFLLNGFIAFGDGPKDEQLVKCGVRIHAKRALIVQGLLKGGKQTGSPVKVDRSDLIDVRVIVDIGAQKVTLTAKGVTVEAPLARKLEAITHAGYCVDGACTDFAPLEITGE